MSHSFLLLHNELGKANNETGSFSHDACSVDSRLQPMEYAYSKLSDAIAYDQPKQAVVSSLGFQLKWYKTSIHAC